MAALGSRKNALHASEGGCCLKYGGLLYAASLDQTLIIQLGNDGAHAVIAKAACMVCGRNEAAAKSVHLCKRTNLSSIAEVISIFTTGQARAGSRLNGDDFVVGLAAKHLANERGDQAAKVGTAAGTADDGICLNAIFLECRAGLETDHGLMQEYLCQNGAEHVTITLLSRSSFHCLRDGTAKASRRAGELSINLASNIGIHGRRRRYLCTVGSHDLAAEGLLLIGAFYHVYLAVQSEIGACHGKCGTPLTGAGLSRHALQALLLSVISLSDCGIQLVAAGGVVTLELVIDMCGCLKFFLQAVSTNQG